MPDLRELYQEVILEHSKAPRNYRELATANHKAEGYNPLCGDHFTVYLDLEGDSIQRHRLPGLRLRDFQGVGVHDDAEREGQDQGGSGKTLRPVPQAGDGPVAGEREPGRTGQAGRFFRRLGVSCAGQVRNPGLARITRCDARETGNGVDGVAHDAEKRKM